MSGNGGKVIILEMSDGVQSSVRCPKNSTTANESSGRERMQAARRPHRKFAGLKKRGPRAVNREQSAWAQFIERRGEGGYIAIEEAV